MTSFDGSVRPLIESVSPCVSDGKFAVKRVQGDKVTVTATVILDGHDQLCCELLFRHETEKSWSRLRMSRQNPGRDVWEISFRAEKIGNYFYTVEARVDRFETWRGELKKKVDAGQDVSVELLMGVQIMNASLRLAPKGDRSKIRKAQKSLQNVSFSQRKRVKEALRAELLRLMEKYPDRSLTTRFDRELLLDVDRERGAFSAWYEFFPRSTALEPGKHGSFRDSERMIPYIAEMGFDVIYLPPIHPIGTIHRKGPNNSLTPGPNDPGSPWAIGSKAGGHKSLHPQLGTLADFRRFVAKAKKHRIEIALDLAFQCAPDHPYVRSHPEWFKKRPDGTIQYAENPPKKYQDIYPFDFESPSWPALWEELKSVVLYWVKQGVRIFRVDNPHTKPVRFWAWLISEVRRKHPDVLFLAEAFTRPAMMYHLGKIGFSQSYTYFTWRNTPEEFRKYLTELTSQEVADTYRPNFWPNTPDILPKHLQTGGRPALLTRVALAATLSSNYGIYGPAYEQGVTASLKKNGKEDSEEYLDSEKYEIKNWKLRSPKSNNGSIHGFIARINRIRRDNPALQRTEGFRFIECSEQNVLCFARQSKKNANTVLVVANLDFGRACKATLTLPLQALGFDHLRPYEAKDLLSDTTEEWEGAIAKFKMDPEDHPVRIFRLSQGSASR